MAYTQTFRDKVYGALLGLETGKSYPVKPESIETVKEFIRLDMSNEFYIEFNDNYTEIIKLLKNNYDA